jgi:hypothetical protein
MDDDNNKIRLNKINLGMLNFTTTTPQFCCLLATNNVKRERERERERENEMQNCKAS